MMIIIYYYIFICLIMGIQGSLDKKNKETVSRSLLTKKTKNGNGIYIYTLSYCTQQ